MATNDDLYHYSYNQTYQSSQIQYFKYGHYNTKSGIQCDPRIDIIRLLIQTIENSCLVSNKDSFIRNRCRLEKDTFQNRDSGPCV